ncbi:phosphoribosylglycinamide formyltransferase [Leptolyngbya sp. KIOST-1]|uniref:phosphoribosylglycinamide formyltransferase n=1 Tax=Leptolyngbya sp. KIOST-1 TaxID=1229172 RepID=UPI00056C3D92|nr:phosphoribosylglycinamide formyltransferase [Leptolyngbya sp. KIOST-1]
MLETAAALISPPLPGTWPRFESPLRLGVMASGNGSNLEAIARSIQRDELHAEIRVVIYNNPGAGVAERAARLGLPAVLLNHRHYPSREALDSDIVHRLQAHGVDWVIMAGWMRCVTTVLIDAFAGQILNIHPSLLPSFPGLRAVEQALAAGVRVAGCTVHQVELAVDSGPVIMQAAVSVEPTDTAATLQARIQVQEHRIYPAAIALAAELT